MDNLMHYCTRPEAESGPVPRGNSFVLLHNPFDEILIAAFLEWSCCRRCGFVAKQKISPNLLNFGLKMFRSF